MNPQKLRLVLGLPDEGGMKATASGEHANDTSVVVRRSDASPLVVVVPDSGADINAVERALIAFALERTDGNRTRAARFLALSRSALIYRMHKHGFVRSPEGLEGSRPEGSS